MTIQLINHRLLAIFLAALVPAAERLSGQNVNRTDVPAAMLALQDVEHRLTSAMVAGIQLSLPEHPAITIKFHSDGKISGDAGVNRYFGGVALMPDGAFQWEPPEFATTRIAGEPKLMEWETQFLKGLRTTRFIRLQDAEIAMVSYDELTTFKFARMTVATSFSSIQDLDLRLVRLVMNGKQVAMPGRGKITFRVSQGMQFSGQSLINGYSGSFLIKPDGRLELHPRVESTLMAGDPAWMEAESAYFTALTIVQRLRLIKGGLILETEDKSVVIEFSAR